MAAIELRTIVCHTLAVSALVTATGCADSREYGLYVEDVDATFGLARMGAASSDAAAAVAQSGNVAPALVATQDTDASAALDGGVAPSADTLPDAAAGPVARACRNVAGFTDNVIPAVLERCVRCHDGTKSKATKTLDFTSARDPSSSARQVACSQALKAAPDTSEQSPLFAEVNPADAMSVHDFKYPSNMAYAAYRSAVLVWLESETAH